jgi:hypothetical protein
VDDVTVPEVDIAKVARARELQTSSTASLSFAELAGGRFEGAIISLTGHSELLISQMA